MEIRLLDRDDLPGVVPLLSELGYPTDGGSLAARMDLLEDDPNVKIWVAVEDNGEIVGLMSGHLSRHIELDGPVARLTALVTDESVRGKGVGQQLMDQFEAWGKSCGAVKAVLSSGSSRSETHEIYRHLGWQSDGIRFTKSLL